VDLGVNEDLGLGLVRTDVVADLDAPDLAAFVGAAKVYAPGDIGVRGDGCVDLSLDLG
jgi:hypothetical protein